MEIGIVIVFILYIGYREWMINVAMRDLEVKLLAKDLKEYENYVKKPVEIVKKVEKEDELVDPLEVNVDDAIKGI